MLNKGERGDPLQAWPVFVKPAMQKLHLEDQAHLSKPRDLSFTKKPHFQEISQNSLEKKSGVKQAFRPPVCLLCQEGLGVVFERETVAWTRSMNSVWGPDQ